MARFEQIRDRLPTLYRPDEDDASLLTLFLRAVADVLEEANRDASDVLQAHWFDYADRALYSPYFICCRQLQDLVQLRFGDQVDLRDPAALAAKLRDATDLLSQYLRENFSSDTQQLLDDYDGSSAPSEALERALIDELNERLKNDSLYDEQRFVHVTLTQETKRLVEEGPEGNDLIRLNLLLLEQAYPNEIAKSLLDFPYIHDLARLSSVLALPPWLEPPTLRESVEGYRLRIKRIVALYRNGLGTVDALRSMVEAQLPTELAEIPERRDRALCLEEFAPLIKRSLAVSARGEPKEMVGPLMCWTMKNDGLESTPPTIYIQGVEPQEDLVDATENPLIELYKAADSYPRLGIAYQATIPSGETLRLQPAFASWIGLATGIRRAQTWSTENGPADPTVPGPWYVLNKAPSASVVAIHQVHDRTLWVATNADGAGTVWRYEGRNWIAALEELPLLHCLAEDGQALLIGTDTGLLRMQLYPEEMESYTASTVLDGEKVYAIFRAIDGQWWAGTENGALQVGPDDTIQPSPLQGTAVYAVTQDRTGTLYFGAELGLFQYQPEAGHWYWYAGKEHTEQAGDWQQFFPEKEGEGREFPIEEEVFLPQVRCVHRGPDASLWIGTDNGIARYIARSVRGLTYRTVLEAFPDLTTGRVFDIKEDARGLIWFCTDRGLFRYDGRDFWQFTEKKRMQRGRANMLYNGKPEPRGFWRFHRSSSEWQRYNDKTKNWDKSFVAASSSDNKEVHTIAWTDQLDADLGSWDGKNFIKARSLDVSKKFVVRYKPGVTRIVDGGIPAVPRLPSGLSVWRYLSLEPEEFIEPEDRPSWTVEGRLLPPPTDATAPGPGRYDIEAPPPSSDFDEAVFAFKPAAKVWFEWEASRPLTVLVRLEKRYADEHIDPAILDRVWQGIQQVRPAGVRAMLAVEQRIVRGGNHEPSR